MPKASAEPHELRACAECRKRKSKCSGGPPPCLFCSRTNKLCRFGHAPPRTPLTRKNLDSVERRCANLTALIRRLNPDVDIENALRTVTATSETDQFGDSRARDSPESADEYEWSEATLTSPVGGRKEALDGMASLPTGNTEAGYLGTSAGSTILRNVPGMQLQPPEPGISPSDPGSSITASIPHGAVLSAHLFDSGIQNELIDAYFTCYNTSYPILHERTFRRKCQDRQQIEASSSWHAIFYAVLAIGSWIRGGATGSEQCPYQSAARSRMSMQMLESGTLVTVQAFLLMGNYLQKRDRPNTAYNFIGIAYRMALGLGLHREAPPGTKRDSLFRERKRVIWWIVYCFDSGFSITTGRPIMASDSFIETQLPRNIDDTSCVLSSAVPPPIDQPTTYSAIIAQARLASIGNIIYGSVVSIPRGVSLDPQTSRSLDHQLKAWKLSLPLYFTAREVPGWFRGPRAIILWKEQNLRMMLWWASQRLHGLTSDTNNAWDMCHYVAIETIQDITTFCSDYPHTIHAGLSWYATYFLFQATVVLSIHYMKPHHLLGSSLDAINQDLWTLSISRARDCLVNLSRDNAAAARCLAVLDRIRDQSQQPQQSASSPSVEMATTSITLENPLNTQVQPITESSDMQPPSFGMDPTLQVLFQDVSWNNNLFEGLEGFPTTHEPEAFDFILSNGPFADTPED